MACLAKMNKKTKSFTGSLGLLFLLVTTCITNLDAAEVSVAVSQRETYVGLPIQLQVRIQNASKHDQPVVDDVDGLKIEAVGRPSHNSQITIINGRASRSETISYLYLVTPLHEGTFTIPPIKVNADGLATITKAVRIVASKSETGDLMFVEIESGLDEVFVGQPVSLRLKIYVRPFRDPETKRPLSESELWQQVSEQTEWSVFTDALQELRNQRSQPRGRSVLREDDEGNSREYYLYEIDTMLYPDRPGPINVDEVRVVMNYPTAIRERRDPFGGNSPFSQLFEDDFFPGFGSRRRVASVKPIAADAKVENIQVKPIPTDGQPSTYRGAVGRYVIGTEASPKKVSAGEPITLRIGIRGNGPMNLVQPPPLSQLPELTSQFRVEDDAMGGLVDGEQKLFTTTIRPLSDSVNEIPAIPFTFFDPDTETFKTVHSNPITIEVSPADMLALSNPARGGSPSLLDSDSDSQVSKGDISETSPSSAVFNGDLVVNQDLLTDQTVKPILFPSLWAAISIPPLSVLGLWIVCLARSRRWTRMTAPAACRLIARADCVDRIVDIVEQYVRSRYGLRRSESSMSREALVGQLRSRGESNAAVMVERFFHSLSDHRGVLTDETDQVQSSATKLVQNLDSTPSLSNRDRMARQTIRTTTMLFVLLSPLTMRSAVAQADTQPSQTQADQTALTSQHQQLLTMGLESYERGRLASAPEDRIREFEHAADQFQALIDMGVQNADLHFNLGNAYFASNRPARALACYLRALRISPNESNYVRNLQAARSALTLNSRRSFPFQLLNFVSAVPASLTIVVTAVAWIVFWATFAWRILVVNGRPSEDQLSKDKPSTAWLNLVSMLALVVTMAGAGLYYFQVWPRSLDHHAVVTSETIEVRQGDDESFESSNIASVELGQIVSYLHRRAGWTQIELDDGTTSWVKDKDLDFI
ncbi:BatD family protein [Rubripirellula amarantea]|nr:BatD family protein [Rubripirellula amarantea]